MHTEMIDTGSAGIACLVSETKAGPVLVFVHGAGSTGRVWQAQWTWFGDKAGVIVPDLPGHGGSGGSGCDSIDAYADTVVRLMQKLDRGKYVLIGHSMGGATAQTVALLHPELLSGLVLVSTGSRLRVAPQVFSSIETDYRQYLDISVSFSLSESADERTKQAFRDVLSTTSPGVAYNDFKACDRFDVMERIAGIPVRTLILAGDRDMLTPLKYSRFLHEKISGSALKVFGDAGHMVMMEKPEEVNREIESFLSSIP